MGNTPRKPRIVSFKLERDLDRELSELARRKNVSRSAVVREALRSYSAGRKPSALDLARDLAGCLTGPADLSTNKRYMKNFGK